MESQTFDKLFEELSPDRQALLTLVYDDEKIKYRDYIVLKVREIRALEQNLLKEDDSECR